MTVQSALRKESTRYSQFLQDFHTFGYLLWSTAVAARGEIGREGCEILSLVEHMGLSPWLFL